MILGKCEVILGGFEFYICRNIPYDNYLVYLQRKEERTLVLMACRVRSQKMIRYGKSDTCTPPEQGTL